ncbi:hypothetical protein [Streptomyces sp. SJL17-1]|uniref:hypothetical protein n=1 Tax=Streptomyces sp. SJL17-1 TaxID=2967223 RepID=UPI0029669831|nr:hypothetical protein [Streptomyces sp. SJL17-1]
MKRLAPTVTGIAAVLLSMPLATGCGVITADGPDAASTRTTQGASGTPGIDYEARAEAARAEHDRTFPTVAKICADAPAEPSAEPTPSEEPTDPWARRVAENNAYKTQARMDGDARCRGDAHARRITGGLEGVHDEKGSARHSTVSATRRSRWRCTTRASPPASRSASRTPARASPAP